MDDPSGLDVVADGLGLKGPRGWAFRDVSVDAGPGALIALTGPSGSGRTCLLLALTGRMKPTEGRAVVGGLELPRRMAAVRRRSGLAHVAGVTDLEPALTVAEHLREQELLRRRFGDALPRPRQLLRPRAERRRERRRTSTRRWPPPGSTWPPCPRASGPRCGTWSGWRRCGCRWRWPCSGVPGCWGSTTPT